MAEALVLAFSWGLAGILLFAAWHKVRYFIEFRGILEQYRLLPTNLVPLAALVIVSAEITTGLALLAPVALQTRVVAALMTAMLLSLYTGAIAINLFRGRAAIDCGCGGRSTPLSGWLLTRNGILLGFACVIGVVPTASGSLGSYLLAAATTGLLWVLYASGNQLLANRDIVWEGQGQADE